MLCGMAPADASSSQTHSYSSYTCNRSLREKRICRDMRLLSFFLAVAAVSAYGQGGSCKAAGVQRAFPPVEHPAPRVRVCSRCVSLLRSRLCASKSSPEVLHL